MQEWLGRFIHRPQWFDRPFSRPLFGAVSPGELSSEIRRKLRLTPMVRLLKEIERRGVNLSGLNALEVFSGNGRSYMVDYSPFVKSVEAWEIDPTLAPILRENIPTATVKTVDSFMEMRLTQNKYDLIFLDPPYKMFGGHCEHFDAFPSVFRILNTFSMLVLSNVRLKIVQPEYYSGEHLEKRQRFYSVDDPKNITVQEMLTAYEALTLKNGFFIKWSFLMDRIFMYPIQQHSVDRTCFLVLALQRKTEA